MSTSDRERAFRVAIDARKLTNAESGVGNYTLNLIQHLKAEDPNLELMLVQNGRRARVIRRSPPFITSKTAWPPSPCIRSAGRPIEQAADSRRQPSRRCH